MGRSCEELVLKVLQGLERRVQDIALVLLQDVEPLEDVPVHLVELHLRRLQGRLRLEEPPIRALVVPLDAVVVDPLRSIQLQEATPALLQVHLQIPIIGDVVPHRIHDIEVHVAPQLRDGAVGGVRARDLVGGLLHLAAVGLDQGVVHMREPRNGCLRQRHQTLREGIYTLHENLYLLVDVLDRVIENTEVANDALEHRVHVLSSEPSLLEHAPLRTDVTDLVLDGVHPRKATVNGSSAAAAKSSSSMVRGATAAFLADVLRGGLDAAHGSPRGRQPPPGPGAPRRATSGARLPKGGTARGVQSPAA
mmetsp:Transcript_37214/g.98481  ORF Transcript_37214/g.98481 Transcript_37214/m.98481 type:complete len:307 (+) Transcript_37214:1592-2512(+)